MFHNDFLKKDLVIAAVAMSGEYEVIGKDMLSGIQLCLDHVNSDGGINGRKVTLDVYDDKGDRNTAVKVAMEIAKRNKALLVLGHYFSTTSLAAGKLYLKERIPSITGSATSENITNKNEWYFSVIPNNNFQGQFIASYIYASLGHKSCSVIYDADEYGKSLFSSFESKANILGLDIKNVWHFDTKSSTLNDQLNKIISELRTIPNPGIFFLATHAREGGRLVSSIKYPGSKYQIFGPDSFSTNSFIKEISKYPQEKTRPGYYSDNIYTISPFLADFANDRNPYFFADYLKKYSSKPTWVSACYYDATLMALKSMLNIDGSENIRDARKIIRNNLKSHYNLESSVKGICGPLFFDNDRNVKFPLKVIYIKNHAPVPYYLQYYTQLHPMNDEKAFEKILNNQLKTSGNIVMDVTRIVFSGIHVNEVKNINILNGTYEMDFFIWFRFKGEFDDNNIVFLNALNPVHLNKIFTEYKVNDIVTRVYHLKEQFKSDFDFSECPFEKHELSIQFRHLNQTLKKVTYIPDNVNESFVNEQLNIHKQETVQMPSEWKVCDTDFYNGIISYESSFGIPIDYHLKRPVVYSTGNAVVNIKRSDNKYALKLLAPAIMLFLFLVVICISPLKFTSVFLYSLISIMVVSGYFLIKSCSFFEFQNVMFVQYIYLSLFTGTCLGLLCCLLILFYAPSNKRKNKMLIVSRLFIFIIMFAVVNYAYFTLFYTTDIKMKMIHVYKNLQ
ncbi:MAG: ABC transporter substrate-binding protein [Candidatus Magnetomorum sp.]|nr:ABC transporter substrate-binding protein [Candidatus Magnetomorum sp.]